MDDHDPLVALDYDPATGLVHQPYSAFNQGFDAGEQGIPISLNPYEPRTTEARWLNMGHEHGNGKDCTE